ncbi:MAG TPA: hypothetical protein VHI51_03325 [Ktedonobacterales bacterium]|jgi:hypothetical protein|nr:hypothetical protein [Ktedonobacterales bacterium]
MHTSSRQAAEELRAIEQARIATARRSADNGVALIVLGLTFLLDMVAFDLSRPTGSPLPAVIFLCGFNSAIVGWLWWYTRRLPIRLRRIVTSRVVFLWSWFYVALVGLGVGAWVIVIGWYPPLWFTLLGVIGAAPLLISGAQLWRRAHTGTALAISVGAAE